MGAAYKRVSSRMNKILRLTFEMINHQFIKRYLTTKALSGSLDIFTPNFCSILFRKKHYLFNKVWVRLINGFLCHISVRRNEFQRLGAAYNRVRLIIGCGL